MAATRKEFLLGGRRVLLADLIGAGLLHVGEQVFYERPYMEEVYEAEVTAQGHLRIADGRSFQSPSRAASTAAGQTAVAGWQAWRLRRNDQTIDQLRQQLLHDEVSAEVDADEDEQVSSARRDFLVRARDEALSETPLHLTVRELLARWGAKSRGSRVVRRVVNDLTNYGLIVEPDFRAVSLEAMVAIRAESQEVEGAPIQVLPVSGATPPSEPTGDNAGGTQNLDARPAEDDDDGSVDYEVAVTLGNLQESVGTLVSAGPGWSLDRAITTMILHDYSQLPVMANKHKADFAVTWKSISEAKTRDPNADLRAACRPVTTLPYTERLVDVLERLQTEEFVLVRGATGEVDAIVTAADVVKAYGNLALPFFLIGELDQALRRIVAAKIPFETVKELCDPQGKRIGDFNSMSFGDYQRVVENGDAWGRLNWSLDRQAFVEALGQLRETRNDVMHFNPDPVPADFAVRCRQMISVIADHLK